MVNDDEYMDNIWVIYGYYMVNIWVIYRGFHHHGGTPSSLAGLFHGKSDTEMDDDWGCPLFQETSMHLIWPSSYL